MLNRRTWALAGLAVCMAGAAMPLAAQTGPYPNRPVKLIVPFPPGGPVDTTARILSQKLSELWSQSVIIENRSGAGGSVGAEFAARQPADGYSLFIGAIHHSVLPSLRPKLAYDIEKDFVPVSFAASFPIFLVANPSLPVKNVKDLIALAKQKPGAISFSSSGSGGGTHLAGELFNMQAGVQLQHIPYRGSAPAMSDLLGGQVQLMFSDAPTALQHIKSGRAHVLGVASPQRSTLLPDVPTIAEAGVPGYEAYSWAAVFVQAGTPADVVSKLNADINQVLSQPDTKKRLYEAGAEAQPSSQAKMAEILKTEIRKWQKVVKTANIQAD